MVKAKHKFNNSVCVRLLRPHSLSGGGAATGAEVHQRDRAAHDPGEQGAAPHLDTRQH